MIVSELRVYNFRRFKSVNNEPGLKVSFHKGLNALIGENDAGKTAVIDAIKMVLLAQGNEYVRPTEDDFYVSSNGESSSEFKIDLVISDFTDNEAKNFIELLKFEKKEEKPVFFLELHYKAWKDGHRIYNELRAGDPDEGVIVDSKARELLKAVYLKPLRDAAREMSSGRGSRVSQLLLNHPVFKNKNEHKVIEIFKNANREIEEFFSNDKEGSHILQTIRDTLQSFSDNEKSGKAELKASDMQLKAILESLSLSAAEINPGLGELNLLFIAAELLLLKNDVDGGMRLALIEELEAHLHPQAQLRLISYLQNEYSKNNMQIILSTHSPILASKINLKNLILMKNGVGYDLSDKETMLERGDYLFLQRFLDSTKANLFFAKGIIMVEGDAESILIPVIAEILGYPLEKYGVSVVNVGGTAFLRYSRILLRRDKSDIGIPVSVVTDCDVKPTLGKDGFDAKEEESKKEQERKNKKYSVQSVRGFTSPRWTLEYCLALSCLGSYFHKALLYGKKIQNAKQSICLTNKKIAESNKEYEILTEKYSHCENKNEVAYNIFSSMLNENGSSNLKGVTAQCLSALLKWEISCIPEGLNQDQMFDIDLYGLEIDKQKSLELKKKIQADEYLDYLVGAVEYAAGVLKEEI